MSDLVNNEQTKLTANAMNAIAVSCVVTGGLTPIITGHTPLWFSVCWVVIGAILHLEARKFLRRLK